MDDQTPEYVTYTSQLYHAHMLEDMDELIAAIKELTKAVNNLTKSNDRCKRNNR